MDMQQFFDALGEASRLTRANYHLTLGKLREIAESYPEARFVLLGGDHSEGVAETIGDPHSYRGYYADCSFETVQETKRGREIAAMCDTIERNVYEGYKGGEYRYGPETPLWVAPYGCTGSALVGAVALPTHPDDGGGVYVVLETREID